ncbi:MAG: hypothetical protein ACUVWJ_09445 [Spirochaetota bacterium]
MVTFHVSLLQAAGRGEFRFSVPGRAASSSPSAEPCRATLMHLR